jgi:hypothetical protein
LHDLFLTLDKRIVKYYIGYIKIKFKTLPFILVGQLLVVEQSRLKEIQTLAHPELIPGLLAGLFLLSPGAPLNNCRWASIQWTWDQIKWSGFYR